MALNITGSMVALVTPFDASGKVDFVKLGEHIDFQLENHTDALVVLGTTGESATMSHEEDTAVCEFAIKRVAGRVPVIAGSGSNCTETMLEKSLMFQKLGADGLLLISPYYNKANAEGMYRHFATVADKVSIPCILYNVPGRTGCSIPVGTVERLAKHPNIAGIKEASGDIAYASKIARFLSDDFRMWSGNDDIIVPMMSLGASGVISVLANICPAETHDMVMSYVNGDVKGSLALQMKYLQLIYDLFIEVNPIPVKAALEIMGKFDANYRLPLYPMTAANYQTLRVAMSEVGLI